MLIQLKRVYEPAADSDGCRILVDKLWPRGIKKSDLKHDTWAKDITPSPELRRFFHADPEANWEAFAQRYRDELTNNPALDALAAQLKENKTPVVTLLYGFRNPLRNHAVILREALMEKLNL